MSAYTQKLHSLQQEGYFDAGVVLANHKNGKRCTLDHYGRVQWWESTGSGEMVAAETTTVRYFVFFYLANNRGNLTIGHLGMFANDFPSRQAVLDMIAKADNIGDEIVITGWREMSHADYASFFGEISA